jgi:hypothetical protein
MSTVICCEVSARLVRGSSSVAAAILLPATTPTHVPPSNKGAETANLMSCDTEERYALRTWVAGLGRVASWEAPAK